MAPLAFLLPKIAGSVLGHLAKSAATDLAKDVIKDQFKPNEQEKPESKNAGF